ncbi:follistatin-related protein 5-like [Thrips palmi]|uniref:Follistatin-related protein 5-like n=1 Tax=Thrips palmi TaxID=161013 RepID=A0A6P8ZB79_THRPL|nr:follistatin-related protein 5-like [Thrips palmi]
MQALKHTDVDRQLLLFKSELECPDVDYDKMKDKMLRHYEKRMRGGYASGKGVLLNLLFIHLDKNKDGHLDHAELDKVLSEVHADWPENCRPSLLIIHDDSDGDEVLSSEEFVKSFNKTKLSYPIEGVSLVTLDKDLQWVSQRAKQGDNVELACDVSGTPAPPIVWERNGVYLGTSKPAGAPAGATEEPPHYPAVDLGLRVFEDGSLFIPNTNMYHAGNFSCYTPRNTEVVQNHHLDVYTTPTVTVEPRVQTRQPGEDAVVFCHVTGEPFPQVQWLKGEEPLRATDPRKYVTIGNGTELRVRHVDFTDTGVYFCQAKSGVGTTRDMSTLIVMRQDAQSLKLQTMQHRFFVFHDRGISIHEPRSCHMHHYIRPATVIPGTQSALCGDNVDKRCIWGEALNVEDRYIYVTQPYLDRIIVISVPMLAVVEAIATDKYPVRLTYVPHTSQVWVLNWRSEQDRGAKTIQVIRDAVEKRKHVTVHLEPVRGQFDLIQGLFLPPMGRDLMRGMRFGYVSHARRQALSKVDLEELRYARTVDLSRYSCVPVDVAFSALYGFVLVRCQNPRTGQDSKLLLLDYMTDAVLAQFPNLAGRVYVTPDSRKLVALQEGKHGVDIVVMRITAMGLSFHFDIRSTLNVSDVAFYPSTSAHGYDLFATTVDKDDILFLDLFTGQVEMITGAGKPLPASKARFGAASRPIYSPRTFDRYLVSPGYDAVFVVNGHARAVNCEVGGVDDPRLAVWAASMPA